MHNCALGADEYFEKYRGDVKRWLDRWTIHPAHAVHLVTIYQDILDRTEHFQMRLDKRDDMAAAARSGQSLAESSELMSGLMQHLKAEAVKYMNQQAARK